MNRPTLLTAFVMTLIALVAAACTEAPPERPTAAPRAPTAAPLPTAEPAAAQFPYTVADSRGKNVVFEEPPTRIVAFDGAAVDILFDIGEAERIVATHSFVSYPPEAEEIPKVGDSFNMNVEAIVGLEPDLVFVFFDARVDDLQQAGLKVLYLESLSDNFRKTVDTIHMWGRITGNADGAAAGGARFESRVQRLEELVAPLEGGVRVLQDVGGLWTPGPDTLVGEVFSLLKLENIAHDISGYAQMSPEQIVARDPQVIITSDPAAFTENSAFSDVSAVKEGKVFSLPSDALSNAGPRFAEGIEDLARLVYPDLFSMSVSEDEGVYIKEDALAYRALPSPGERPAA